MVASGLHWYFSCVRDPFALIFRAVYKYCFDQLPLLQWDRSRVQVRNFRPSLLLRNLLGLLDDLWTSDRTVGRLASVALIDDDLVGIPDAGGPVSNVLRLDDDAVFNIFVCGAFCAFCDTLGDTPAVAVAVASPWSPSRSAWIS